MLTIKEGVASEATPSTQSGSESEGEAGELKYDYVYGWMSIGHLLYSASQSTSLGAFAMQLFACY